MSQEELVFSYLGRNEVSAIIGIIAYVMKFNPRKSSMDDVSFANLKATDKQITRIRKLINAFFKINIPDNDGITSTSIVHPKIGKINYGDDLMGVCAHLLADKPFEAYYARKKEEEKSKKEIAKRLKLKK